MPSVKEKKRPIRKTYNEIELYGGTRIIGEGEIISGAEKAILAEGRERGKILPRRIMRDLGQGRAEKMPKVDIELAYRNIELTRQRIRNNQVEIGRLRAETRTLIAELMS